MTRYFKQPRVTFYSKGNLLVVRLWYSFFTFVSSGRKLVLPFVYSVPLSENRSYAINFAGTGWAEFIFTPLCPRVSSGTSVLSFPLRLLLVFGYFARPSYLVEGNDKPREGVYVHYERPFTAFRINLRFCQLSGGSMEFSWNFASSTREKFPRRLLSEWR